MLRFNLFFIFLIIFFLNLDLQSLNSINLDILRDPFSFKPENDFQQNIQLQNYLDIKVLAVLNSNKKGVILQKQEEQLVVFIGDDAWGYNIEDISSNEVIIFTPDKNKMSLFFEF